MEEDFAPIVALDNHGHKQCIAVLDKRDAISCLAARIGHLEKRGSLEEASIQESKIHFVVNTYEVIQYIFLLGTIQNYYLKFFVFVAGFR